MAYTDLFNEAIGDLAATLGAISGLTVYTDPRNISAPCVFIDAPRFTAINYNVVKMSFDVKVIGSGPGDKFALQNILSKVAAILSAKTGTQSGAPGVASIGGTEMPCYDIVIDIQAQTN